MYSWMTRVQDGMSMSSFELTQKTEDARHGMTRSWICLQTSIEHALIDIAQGAAKCARIHDPTLGVDHAMYSARIQHCHLSRALGGSDIPNALAPCP